MKLRTSFFNARALGKNITRFSPVWALYSVALAILFLVIKNGSPNYMARNMVDAYMALGVFNVIYAPICALLLFGDLLNSRMCNALHALPMRREGWFLTHITSAFLFAFVPNGIFSLVCGLLIAPNIMVAAMFFAIAMLQFLFFFGAATLSIFCAGNRLAAAVVYAIINFLPMLVYALLYNHYVPLLYGLTVDADAFMHLCPIYAFSEASYADFYAANYGFVGNISEIPWEDWRYLFIAAGVGVAFLILSVVLYRRRNLECAGDFVAFKGLGPVFLVIYTAAVGTLLYTIGNELLNDYEYLLLAIGLIVGYFTGRMLLDRTVKVFHKKSLLGFGIMTVVLALTMYITYLDPMGVVTEVPQLQDIKSVSITTGSMYYPYNQGLAPITNQETIQDILDVHQHQATTRDDGDRSVTITIRYTLKDGTSLLRKYPMNVESAQAQSLKPLFSSWLYLFGVGDQPSMISIESVRLDDGVEYKDTEITKKVLEALYQDSLSGNLVQDWSYHPGEGVRYWIGISFIDANGSHDYLDLVVFESCHSTVAVLEEFFEQNGGLK